MNNTAFPLDTLDTKEIDRDFNIQSKWQTIYVNGGKKTKMRAGDLLGALTAGIGLEKNDVGKIDILEFCSYVALRSNIAKKSASQLENTKIKGKYYKIYLK
jgi:ATP-independent RNA helicase DbpA